MPIKNYTTDVDVYKTLGTIQADLVKHGAKKIVQDYDDAGRIVSLCFMIDTPNGPHGIRLPANVDAVWSVLQRQKVKCDRAQAERVAWRTGELTYYLCNRTDFVVSADGFCNFGRRRTNNG